MNQRKIFALLNWLLTDRTETRMIITKKHIGETVYLVPTGNNVARHKGAGGAYQQVKKAVITKMARTRGTFEFESDYKYEESFSIAEFDNHQVKAGFNAGYEVFESMQEVQDKRNAKKVELYLRSYNSIPTDKLLKIGEILEMNFDEQ